VKGHIKKKNENKEVSKKKKCTARGRRPEKNTKTKRRCQKVGGKDPNEIGRQTGTKAWSQKTGGAEIKERRPKEGKSLGRQTKKTTIGQRRSTKGAFRNEKDKKGVTQQAEKRPKNTGKKTLARTEKTKLRAFGHRRNLRS